MQALNLEQSASLATEAKSDYLCDDAIGDVGLDASAHLDGIRDGDRQERRSTRCRRRRRPRALRRAPLLRQPA
jgi:hypothetical protein